MDPAPPVQGKADGCLLNACRVCTGCAHDRHGTCRNTVRCPSDGQTRTCRCCGQIPSPRLPSTAVTSEADTPGS